MKGLIVLLIVLAVALGVLLIIHIIRLIQLVREKAKGPEDELIQPEIYDFDGTVIDIQENQIIVEISDDCWQHIHANQIAVDYDKHTLKYDAKVGDIVTIRYSGDIKDNTHHLDAFIFSIDKKAEM